MGANSSFPEKPQGGQRPAGMGRYSHPSLATESEQVVLRDKKKKISKLATLRKKLIRVRRHSKCFDHTRAFRELTSTWTIRELNALVDDYKATVALKEMTFQANIARPHANTCKANLSSLYDYKYCTDVDLIYQGVVFPVHRAILCVRCSYFRNLLARYPEYGSQVHVSIRTPGIDVNMFSALLRYLYTGEFTSPDSSKWENLDLLMQLAEEFGTPNPLEQDLKNLLETGMFSDAVLIFSSEMDGHEAMTPEPLGDTRSNKNELHLRCHKAILAARSLFFRNLLMRRARSGEELTERALQSPTHIVLDESVIPRRYARVLLHAIYLDAVDLSCIVRTSVSMCSLSEVQAMVSGKGHMTLTEEAMEIYQIGQFLDFPILSQGCEDIIAESINADNFVSILNWSSEPHGSGWVYRQALHFLREFFLQIAHSPILYELSKDYLLQAINSDFLQAGELDVLSAVMKWGEHQLIKRIEDREPNLLTHTAHSVSRKGIKKRDLNDVELRDILAELLPHIRVEHIIPPNNEVLSSAIKRGVISMPPCHMIGDEATRSTAGAWVQGRYAGVYVKPRLFMPYFDEAKSMLDEQVSQVQENEVVRLRMVHMSAIPDTLYMVEDQGFGMSYPSPAPSSPSTVDIIAGTIIVPDQDTVRRMRKRERELQFGKAAQQAYSLPRADCRAIAHAIHLRVVREFGLPDSSLEILQSSPMPHYREPVISETRYHTPHRGRHRKHHKHYSPEEKHSPSTPVTPVRTYSPVEKEPSTCSDSILSDMMPDIAMASASMNQMSLQDLDLAQCELDLDLGDGAAHSGTGTLYI